MADRDDKKLQNILKEQQRHKRLLKNKRLMRKVTTGFQQKEKTEILTYASALRENGYSQKDIEAKIRKKFGIDVKKEG